ncbi:unnamed protein product [Chrysoparadoxa australica]
MNLSERSGGVRSGVVLALLWAVGNALAPAEVCGGGLGVLNDFKDVCCPVDVCGDRCGGYRGCSLHGEDTCCMTNVREAGANLGIEEVSCDVRGPPCLRNVPPFLLAPLKIATNENSAFIFNGEVHMLAISDSESERPDQFTSVDEPRLQPQAVAEQAQQLLANTVLGVHLTVEHGSMSFSDRAASVAMPRADGVVTYSLEGPMEDVNAALSGAVYLPPPGFHGETQVLITVTDRNPRGTAASVSAAIDVAVLNTLRLSLPADALPAEFTEGSSPVHVTESIAILDFEGDITSTGARLTNPQESEQLGWSGKLPDGLVMNGDGGNEISVTGVASIAEYQAVLRAITYVNLSEDPAEGERTVEFVVNSGLSNASSAAASVIVTGVNDPPEIRLPQGAEPAQYSHGAVAVAPELQVTDHDSAKLVSATVKVIKSGDDSDSSGAGPGVLALDLTDDDVLAVMSIAVEEAGNIMHLTGEAFVAEYEALLQAITYNEADDSDAPPNMGVREVEFVVRDEELASNTVTALIISGPTNAQDDEILDDEISNEISNDPRAVPDQDACLPDPCQGGPGTCFEGSCRCPDGLGGDFCEVTIDCNSEDSECSEADECWEVAMNTRVTSDSAASFDDKETASFQRAAHKVSGAACVGVSSTSPAATRRRLQAEEGLMVFDVPFMVRGNGVESEAVNSLVAKGRLEEQFNEQVQRDGLPVDETLTMRTTRVCQRDWFHSGEDCGINKTIVALVAVAGILLLGLACAWVARALQRRQANKGEMAEKIWPKMKGCEDEQCKGEVPIELLEAPAAILRDEKEPTLQLAPFHGVDLAPSSSTNGLPDGTSQASDAHLLHLLPLLRPPMALGSETVLRTASPGAPPSSRKALAFKEIVDEMELDPSLSESDYRKQIDGAAAGTVDVSKMRHLEEAAESRSEVTWVEGIQATEVVHASPKVEGSAGTGADAGSTVTITPSPSGSPGAGMPLSEVWDLEAEVVDDDSMSAETPPSTGRGGDPLDEGGNLATAATEVAKVAEVALYNNLGVLLSPEGLIRPAAHLL